MTRCSVCSNPHPHKHAVPGCDVHYHLGSTPPYATIAQIDAADKITATNQVVRDLLEEQQPSLPGGAISVQVGGDHYKSMKIQPVEFIHANGIGYFEGNVIKYVARWRAKNGIADLQKAKHYIDLLIELEGKTAVV